LGIDFEKFCQWAIDRFGEDEIKIKNNEVRINSIFCEDYKRKLWCNPYGGKKGQEDRPFGVYHCWKTGKCGNLVNLVMQVDECSFQEAKSVVSEELNLEKEMVKVNAFFFENRRSTKEF